MTEVELVVCSSPTVSQNQEASSNDEMKPSSKRWHDQNLVQLLHLFPTVPGVCFFFYIWFCEGVFVCASLAVECVFVWMHSLFNL